MDHSKLRADLAHAIFADLGRRSWQARVDRDGLAGACKRMADAAAGWRRRGPKRRRSKKKTADD